MALQRVTGNLVDLAEAGRFNIIVHGANCFKTMGSGIAKEIRARYPDAYETDLVYGQQGDYNKLGNFSVMLGKRFNIINAYTQYDYNRGGDNKVHFDYVAFELILRKLAYKYPTCQFGFPLIGCGRAGGNPVLVIEQLERFASQLQSTGGGATLVEFG